MRLMMDGKSGVSGSYEYLFLKRHHVSCIALLISQDGIEVDGFTCCSRIDYLATPEIIV